MRGQGISIGKMEPGCINEDAVLAGDRVIAISDGAGGGGLFAERWSRYLLDYLPKDGPIETFEALDGWIESIWEPFYNRCEEDAKRLNSLALDKFYDEGAFATLVAVWETALATYRWISFGDSVAFHYDRATRQLDHSFGALADFDLAPALINCKDELSRDGFKNGTFCAGNDSVVFVASDALAHYIMMMYEVEHAEQFEAELQAAAARHSKNENYIKAARAMAPFDFEKDVLDKLLDSIGDKTTFRQHLESLIEKGLITHDDYSLAVVRL